MHDNGIKARQSTGADTAGCLRVEKFAILEKLKERIQKEIQPGGGKDSELVLDSLPDFLDYLIDSLENRRPRLVTSHEIGQIHAVQRTELTDFNLKKVMRE